MQLTVPGVDLFAPGHDNFVFDRLLLQNGSNDHMWSVLTAEEIATHSPQIWAKTPLKLKDNNSREHPWIQSNIFF